MSREVERREDGQVETIEPLGPDAAPQEKVITAHKLRVRGMPWTEIAEYVGFASAKVAQVEVRRYLQRSALEMEATERQEMLDLELDRLDALQTAYWPAAMVGDIDSAKIVLKVISQRAKMMGFEKLAEKGNVSSRTLIITGDPGAYVEQIKALVEEG